jgi:hypothetical protein
MTNEARATENAAKDAGSGIFTAIAEMIILPERYPIPLGPSVP